MEKFYLTTAIAYASRKPHFGNTYEIIMTDAFARFQRRMGKEVFLCTGTDEHGQKIENLANEAGITPQAYVDGVSAEIRGIWDLMNVKYDHFIRTTDDYHTAAVRKIFKKFYDKGDIYKGFYEGWYCTPCESFFTATQVVDGKCPDCGREVSQAREEAYFFKMSKYADRLMNYIEEHPEFIEPESRKREMVNNFLKAGLQDLCVSRTSFKWGIPVDFDERHVVYVWLDALTNYITAIGYDPDKSFEEQSEKFKKYWPADVHIIGKDILRFHTIYWPIFLMALELPLPKKVFGHPWFNFGSDKMSKSRGNVVYADELASTFGVDAVRYYALSEMPYAQDGSITYESVITRYNNDLANNLGNLVSRTHAMTKKYFDGIVPTPCVTDPLDDELRLAVKRGVEESIELMGSYHVADSLESIFTMLRRANKYIDETTPWILAKSEEGRARLSTVIYNLLEVIRIAAALLVPYIPATAESIFAQLGTDKTELDTVSEFGALESGKPLGEAHTLFMRIDEKAFLEEIEKKRKAAEAEAQASAEPEHEPEATIDAFRALELRVGQIKECERVPKSKKLFRLIIDLGYESRQVVSGIAEYYTPDELIGKKVIVVANLKPVKLCGVESRGMILASGDSDVRVVFIDPAVKNGERIS
ncbi:MAG: methionine--tRNA ligase [Clostridia bacterium]|nr:methionine--tRNA ligase [Clostridia bacterium]